MCATSPYRKKQPSILNNWFLLLNVENGLFSLITHKTRFFFVYEGGGETCLPHDFTCLLARKDKEIKMLHVPKSSSNDFAINRYMFCFMGRFPPIFRDFLELHTRVQ